MVYMATDSQYDLLLKMRAGALTIMRYGAGPNGPLRTLAQYMIGSGATFGYGPAAHVHANGIVEKLC